MKYSTLNPVTVDSGAGTVFNKGMNLLLLLIMTALPARARVPADTTAEYADSLFLKPSFFKGMTYSFYSDEPGKSITSPLRRGFYAYHFTEEFKKYSDERDLMQQAENLSVFSMQALLFPALALAGFAYANASLENRLWREDINGRLYIISAVLGAAVVPAAVTSAVYLYRSVRERNHKVIIRPPATLPDEQKLP